jgi:hypothetical protein
MSPLLGINPLNPYDFGRMKNALDIVIKNYKGETDQEILNLIESGALGSENLLEKRQEILDGLSYVKQQVEEAEANGATDKDKLTILWNGLKKLGAGVRDSKLRKIVRGVYGAVDDVVKIAAWKKQVELAKAEGLKEGPAMERATAYLSRYGFMYNQAPKNKTAQIYKYGINRFYAFQHQMFGVMNNIIEDAIKGSPITGKNEYAKLMYLISISAIPTIISTLALAGEDEEDRKILDETLKPSMPEWMPLYTSAYVDKMIPQGVKDFLGTDKKLQLEMSRYIPSLDVLGGRYVGYINKSSDSPISATFRYMVSGSPVIKSIYQLAANENAYTGAQIVPKGTPFVEDVKMRGGQALSEYMPATFTNAMRVKQAYDEPISGRTYNTRDPRVQAVRSFFGIDLKSAEPNDYANYEMYAKRKGLPSTAKGDYELSYADSLKREIWTGIANGDFERAAKAELALAGLAKNAQGEPIKGKLAQPFQLTNKELIQMAKGKSPLKFAGSQENQAKYLRDMQREGGVGWEVLQKSLGQYKGVMRSDLPNYIRARKQLMGELSQ